MQNKTSFDSNIEFIEEKIGYTFKNKSLLRQAFTRTSYCNEQKSHTGTPLQSNEVLEFFGDSVLSCAIVTLFVNRFSERYEHGIRTDLHEGDFSNLRSKLSDKKNLSNATRDMGIARFLLMGEGDMKLGISDEPSVMEDLFESIIGAIYIDSELDLKTVIRSVSRMLDIKSYTDNEANVIQSYKNALQEWCADKKHKLPSPVYKTVSEAGPDHKKTYIRACHIGDKVWGTGEGKSQKLADSAAAEAALRALMAEEEKKNKPQFPSATPSDAAIARLKEIASKEKITSPEFRDLGESISSTSDMREYQIECRFKGQSAIGLGISKRDAKLSAAEKLLLILEPRSLKKPKNSNTSAKKSDKTSFSDKRRTYSGKADKPALDFDDGKSKKLIIKNPIRRTDQSESKAPKKEAVSIKKSTGKNITKHKAETAVKKVLHTQKRKYGK